MTEPIEIEENGSAMDQEKPSYEVGYGKPPKSGQFQPGASGNPKGRPKNPSTLLECLEVAINEKVVVKKNGKKVQMPKHQALIESYINAALAGSLDQKNRAIRLLSSPGLGLNTPRSLERPDDIEGEDLVALFAAFTEQGEDEAMSAKAAQSTAPTDLHEPDDDSKDSDEDHSSSANCLPPNFLENLAWLSENNEAYKNLDPLQKPDGELGLPSKDTSVPCATRWQKAHRHPEVGFGTHDQEVRMRALVHGEAVPEGTHGHPELEREHLAWLKAHS